MIQVGELVKIHHEGSSVFAVQELREDGRALVEAVDDVAGRYPFTVNTSALVPAS
ncbi:hypothetical protein [Antrihabitans spumae]|uniref:Uncharacterized protein n=1 Tax=Antrihabitans spumae TaxID=3373370 RepID=A0ABW7JXS1_9NOCA